MHKKIYIKTSKPINNLTDLISILYIESEDNKAKSTYLDKACKEKECKRAYRSFEDLLIIAGTYFPDTKDAELFSILVDAKIKPQRCDDINKITFYKGNLAYEPLGTLQYLERAYEPYNYSDGTYRPEDLIEIYKRIEKEHTNEYQSKK